MPSVRELVTVLKYKLDDTGVKEFGQRAIQAGREVERTVTQAVKKAGDTAVDAGNRAGRAGDEAGRKWKKGMDGADQATKRLSATTRRLVGLLATMVSVRAFINYSEAWNELVDRVELYTGSQREAQGVMKELSAIARRARAPIEQISETWLENVRALRDNGASTEDTLKFTESLNAALDLSAIRGQRAQSVMMALSRAMDMGELKGVNLNTIIQNGGMVAEALAEELGVTVGQLRDLGAEGKITGRVIQNALVNRVEKFRKEIDKGTVSLRDGLDNVRSKLMEFVGNVDRASGVSAFFGKMLLWVGDNIGLVAAALGGIGAVWLSTKTVAIVTGFIATLKLIRDLIIGINLAALANPMVWIIGAIVAAVAGLILLIQDFITWLRGGDSLLGSWYEKIRDIYRAFGEAAEAVRLKMLGALDAVQQRIDAIKAGIAGFFGGIKEGVKGLGGKITGGVSGLWDKATGWIPGQSNNRTETNVTDSRQQTVNVYGVDTNNARGVARTLDRYMGGMPTVEARP